MRKIDYDEWKKHIAEKATAINAFMQERGIDGLYESHAHLNFPHFNKLEEAWFVDTLYKAGVSKVIVPVDCDKFEETAARYSQYEHIRLAIGAHPKYLNRITIREQLDDLACGRYQIGKKVAAIGEIGLDYSKAPTDTDVELQKQVFTRMLEIASQKDLPVILHIRPCEETEKKFDVHSDALRILERNTPKCGAIYHCFGGDVELYQSFRSVGVNYFGIGGRVSFGNEALNEVIRRAPLEHIILETDSPFVRVKGSGSEFPNTPLSLFDIAEHIAAIRNEDTGKIIVHSNENFEAFYRWK